MAKEKLFGAADREAMKAWFDAEMKAGKSFREVRKAAREKYGAFDWATIISILLELIRQWLNKKP